MSPLKCPGCQTELPVEPAFVGARAVTCRVCRESLELETFPAHWRAVPAGRAGDPVTGEEAGCFVHPDRRAEAACECCGRFMCALCEVRVGEQRICVACLENGRRAGRLVQVERSRTLFSLIAIRVALLGILLGPFAPLAGSSAIILAVVGLVRPGGITGRRYVGTAIGSIVLGLLLVVLWLAWWVNLLGGSGATTFTTYEPPS